MIHQSAHSSVDAELNRRKCAGCGLVNFAVNETCHRCGAALDPSDVIGAESPVEPVATRGIGRRLLWLFSVTLTLLFACSRSLLLTSNGLGASQRQAVVRAIALLERTGFSNEALVLRYVANDRATDNWWNLYVGHREAYAATNFPFEVLTLYPAFFEVAVDDTERAVILLHESQHLFGFGEEAALEKVWRDKQRLGWTADGYGQTKVWKNTREWTAASAPELFRCGPDGHSDCVQ